MEYSDEVAIRDMERWGRLQDPHIEIGNCAVLAIWCPIGVLIVKATRTEDSKTVML